MRRRLAALALALAVAAAASAAPARAQDSLEQASKRQIEDLRQKAREKHQAADKLAPLQNRAFTELRRTDSELKATRRRLNNLQQRQQALGAQLVVTRASLEASIASLNAQRERLRVRLRRMYEFGPARELEYLLSGQSFAQLMTRWDFLNMVAQQDRVLLDGVRAQKEEVEQNQHQLEGTLQDVQVNEKRTSRESAKLASLRQQKEKKLVVIQTQRQQYEAAAAELERTARRVQNLLATLERKRLEDAKKPRGEGRAPQPYSGDFARGQGKLDWPVRGAIVSHFGIAAHAKYNTSIRNDGIDIAATVGTPVRAVAKGRVDYVSDSIEGMGGLIVLNHGDGYFTLYGYLDEMLVRNGQEVAPGTVIGKVGEAGSLHGPCLHFQVSKGTVPLDPESWLQ